MIIPTNKDLPREWFLQKLVKFARDKYKAIEIDGEKQAVVLLSDFPRKCSRCNGSGNCQTCDGSGKVYDWGSASVISKEKYTHKCGVCNGRGRCGVCDGKGHIN